MKYYNLSELRDSRLLYDKNPPKFMFYVIGITFLLVAAVVTASIFLHKPYVVKASGIITNGEKSHIIANISGTITKVNLKEGAYVKKGDPLIEFDNVQTKTQVQQADDLIKYYKTQLSLYDKCIMELQKGKNTFNKKDPSQLPFYNTIELARTKMKQYDVSDDEYRAMGYTDDQIKAQQKQNNAQKNSIKLQTISELETQRSQIMNEMSSAQTQRDGYARLLSSYILTAPQSGIVHLSIPVNNGMTLQAGTTIGTIAGGKNGSLELETYIEAQDRAKIKTGETVDIAISGISQSDYGTLKGKIQKIDTDATVNQEKGTVTFKAIITPKTTTLTDKHGDKVNIKPGMVAEAHILYEDTTWFNWVLEQIGIKFS